MPDSDYYTPEAEDDTRSSQPTPDDSGDADTQTALLPKSIFGNKDLEPGTECTIKIEHVYDDEVEVSYVSSDTNSKQTEMDHSMSSLDNMASNES